MARHAVVMLAWGAAARGAEIGDRGAEIGNRGAEIGDADSARAARIELLQEENAKIMRTLEKVRGAISYWKPLGFVPAAVGGASSAEEKGPAAAAEMTGVPGPGRRLESKVPGGVKVWQGGVLHNFKNADSCPAAWSKVPPWRCPSSALAPPQGAPDGSGQRGTPRTRTSNWAPNHCLGGSS